MSLLATALLVGPLVSTARAHPPDPATSPDLPLVGSSALGGKGLNGEVAVVGNTAVVAAGVNPSAGVHTHFYNPYPCPRVRVRVVDIARPNRPNVVGNIFVPDGLSVLDVDAIHVSTPAFTGDLAAVALSICGGDHHSPPSTKPRGVAYYDITNPAVPAFLGRYEADSEDFTPGKTCGPPTTKTDPGACASSQHSVSLMQRPDGRVLSVSTEPFATASGFPSGDLRVVDVTDPRHPAQVGSYPAPRSVSGFSSNGCRPFSAGHDAELYQDGTKALLAYLDDGVMDVDLGDPATPALAAQVDPYPPADRRTEGNGAYATIAGARQNLALLGDEDWIAPSTSLRIDTGPKEKSAPTELSKGHKLGCEAMFTLFDPENTAQIYRHAGSQVPAGAGSSAEIVYGGRGCPVNAGFGTTTPDPYLNDANGDPVNPSGKIVLLDRGATDRQFRRIPDPNNPAPATIVDPNSQVKNAGSGCGFVDKAKRAQDMGAIGVVFDATFGNAAFSADGDPTGLDIPVMSLDKPASTQLRDALCPSVLPAASGNCTPGTPITGAMVDRPGDQDGTSDWGALRVINLDRNEQVGQYETARSQLFPPPDLGVYSVHHALGDGDRAYVAWNSDGLRVLDLSRPGNPVEIGHFVPPDTPDPSGTGLPAKALVTGVAKAGCNIVITDTNSGLYVVAAPGGCP